MDAKTDKTDNLMDKQMGEWIDGWMNGVFIYSFCSVKKVHTRQTFKRTLQLCFPLFPKWHLTKTLKMIMAVFS